MSIKTGSSTSSGAVGGRAVFSARDLNRKLADIEDAGLLAFRDVLALPRPISCSLYASSNYMYQGFTGPYISVPGAISGRDGVDDGTQML